jgi:hypothetical protein
VWTSQRDLDPALVSLDGAHSSLHELDIYSIAMRVPVHSQYNNKNGKGLERPLGQCVNRVLNDFATPKGSWPV